MRNRGFTLIELLLVVSVITLLTSIFTANSTEAREKAADKSKQLQVREIEKAVELHRQDTGEVPQNFTQGGQDTAREGTAAFNSSMQVLVNKGYLPAIPKSPAGNDLTYWASEDKQKAVVGARLSSRTTSTKNSCAPILPYEDCIDTAEDPPPGYSVVFYEWEPAEADAAYDICRAHGSLNCHANSDGRFPNATCFGHAQDIPSGGNQINDLSPCLYLLTEFAMYCKPFADNACSGEGNEYCGCIE